MLNVRTVAPAIASEYDPSLVIMALPPQLQPWKSTIGASVASLASTVIGFPMDTVKTRLQTHKFPSAWECGKQTVRHEGVRGLFRGITAPLISVSITKTISVLIYTAAKPVAAELQGFLYYPLQVSGTAPQWKNNLALAVNNAPISFLSGMVSGACISLFACPFEFTKVFSQISKLVQYKDATMPIKATPTSFVGICRIIIEHRGVRGLYTGLGLHCLRDSIGTGFYYAAYETTKLVLGSLADDNGKLSGTPIPIGPVTVALAGSLSGILSWCTVFPIDTTKSLLQRDIMTNILRKRSGLEPLSFPERKLSIPTRRMYRGLGVSITRSVIVAIVWFGCFENFLKFVA
ncbi:hypothetical protein BABINDRAFT_162788 [Babjeviella inositovora NRRL Y-12698]|uniref:Mitochondrial carrier n=1 Tax=Babjeviella inositovora NRRL Y-12698 TaxID=984486 RepID=A0A1E3QLL9_9ASCO|nr:uncharacterized protein BABINDRAFT_162788 [Babjeviella inositovora NRRL Y-12698]ODQ78583.1 hypothetical protein BABINDRAFT_162788 [Babjeviella inositovora NRRL Y-12698]